MEKKTKTIRKKWLHVRLDDQEHAQMMQAMARSTEKKLSSYARKLLLSKPITIVHRDGSVDALVAVLVKVQNDLNGIANNYNQMVHKLHMSDTSGQVKAWISLYEKEKRELFESIAQMKELIGEGAKKWLR
ncbi:plasmid mobilization protein [Pedobacter chitinilyticus]|uniref:Plasmid mobilization relaxosome protein MobC n=1 Tax=Pedobacter chitinilyticus TaxID=2233776 RepID=A0A443YW45_9SPHI|nr:plasmid mobilization relaxosome protein MobC [Pedobacter chitinilyticus]RWU08186.1 plasmid mobilization relaxosome protein MobC [Pedobacter chitinilyticus]